MTRIGLVGALISVLPLSACGGDEESAAIEGLWALELPDGCVAVLAVEGDRCAYSIACELVSGEIGVQRHDGTCETASGELTSHWERSTCADTDPVYSARYRVTDDQLILDEPSGRLAFERLEGDGEGSAIITYGCWEGDSLVYRDLLPLE